MLKINDYLSAIDSFAPFEIAGDWDNVGLLVGSPEDTAAKVLFALDATKDVILEAEEAGVDLIITHHPLIFDPLTSLSSSDLVYELAKREIGLVAAHTNWDMALDGVSETLARTIGLKNLKPLGPSEKNPEEYFYGGIGELPKAVKAEDFAKHLKKTLSAPGIRYVPREGTIKTVAYCGGSGSGIFFDAVSSGVDAFVTGELDHHLLLEGNRHNMALFLGGHFHTETLAMKPLAEKIQKRLPQAKLLLSKRCTDNINFI